MLSIPSPHPLADRNGNIRRLCTNDIYELSRRYNIRLDLVSGHCSLLKGVSIANKIGFTPRSTDEAKAKSKREHPRLALLDCMLLQVKLEGANSRDIWPNLNKGTTPVPFYGGVGWIKAKRYGYYRCSVVVSINIWGGPV